MKIVVSRHVFLSPILIGVWLLLLTAPAPLTAQEPARGYTYYLYPRSFPSGSLTHVAGLTLAKLPEDVIETDDVFRAPLFRYQLRYGLPHNFLLEGGITTNIVTFHFALGAKWAFGSRPIRFAVGYDVAYWLGHLKQFGFNTRIRGWINYPNILIGYDAGPFAITLTGELILVMSQTEFQADLEVSTDQNRLAGGAVGAFIEQPLWKQNVLLLGFKANFTDFYYPQWAAFSTFERRFFIPEVFVGFVL